MNNKLVVVADLGHLKVYQVEYDEYNSSPRVELVESLNTDEADGRISDKLTDEAGRFHGGQRGQSEIRTYGERHNIKLEFQRRAIGGLAKSINQIVRNRAGDREVFLAANKEIHHQLLDRLDPEVRGRMDKVVQEDLTWVNGTELLSHF
jgi:Protein required for attachment to host cells